MQRTTKKLYYVVADFPEFGTLGWFVMGRDVLEARHRVRVACNKDVDGALRLVRGAEKGELPRPTLTVHRADTAPQDFYINTALAYQLLVRRGAPVLDTYAD